MSVMGGIKGKNRRLDKDAVKKMELFRLKENEQEDQKMQMDQLNLATSFTSIQKILMSTQLGKVPTFLELEGSNSADREVYEFKRPHAQSVISANDETTVSESYIDIGNVVKVKKLDVLESNLKASEVFSEKSNETNNFGVRLVVLDLENEFVPKLTI